jgi:hypothetical protein
VGWPDPSTPALKSPSTRILSRLTRFRLIAGATVALICSLLLPTVSHAAETGLVPDLTWGGASRQSTQSQTAAAIKDLGAQWVRLNISWKWAEPNKGSYDSSALAAYDRAVQYSIDSGAKIILMVDEAPGWAAVNPSSYSQPRDPADYANFVHFLAARYAGRVQAYEIWNEENFGRFWDGGPNPGAYAGLLKAAYPAVKSADPNAKVLFGGTSRNDYTFLEGVYAASPDIGNYFDVMATHPYPDGGAPPEAYWRDGSRISPGAFAGYREVRATLLAHGNDKPIWFTEFGWATTSQPGGVSLQTQADYLTRAYRCMEQDSYVQVATWYNLRNNFWANNADDWEDQTGLLYTNFSQKPSYSAFKSYRPGAGGCTYTDVGTAADASTAPPAGATSPTTVASSTTRRPTSTSLRLKRAHHSSRTASSSAIGRKVTALGRVRNGRSGRVRLEFQRRDSSGAWQKKLTRKARLSSSARFAKVVTLPTRGRWRVRAVYQGSNAEQPSRSRLVPISI